MTYSIAIIGGGVSAVAQVAQLLKELKALNPVPKVKVVVYEKDSVMGAGLPYASQDDCYILNLPPASMDVLPDCSGHFAQWLKERYPDHSAFPPRHYFGQYVAEIALQLQNEAKEMGIEVEYSLENEVTDVLALQNKTYQVKSHKGDENFNGVILCTGHLPSSCYTELNGCPQYAHNALSPHIYKEILPHHSVLILGTRLTAIDTAMKLRSIQHQGEITMASRSGLLPTVLSEKVEDYTLQWITIRSLMRLTQGNSKPLQLSDLLLLIQEEFSAAAGNKFQLSTIPRSDKDIKPLDWLNREIDEAINGKKAWQNVLFALYPIIPAIWPMLHEHDQKEFMQKYYSTFMAYMAAFPLQNANKVKGMIDSGQLTVTGGISSDIQRIGDKYRFAVHGKEKWADWVINATGPGFDIEQVLLYKKMLKSQTIFQNPLGGIKVHPYSLEVLDIDDKPYTGWYCIGNPTIGGALTMLDVGQMVHQAGIVAANINKTIFNHQHSKLRVGRGNNDVKLSSAANAFFHTQKASYSTWAKTSRIVTNLLKRM